MKGTACPPRPSVMASELGACCPIAPITLLSVLGPLSGLEK